MLSIHTSLSLSLPQSLSLSGSVASPPELAGDYSERRALLPGCYYLNDHVLAGCENSQLTLTEAELGSFRCGCGAPNPA